MKKALAALGLLALITLAWLHFGGEPPEMVTLRLDVPKPCADNDPCTFDVWHRFKRQCLHIPDVLCTRPCDTVADCVDTDPAYPSAAERCVQAQCVAQKCRYMKIARDECAACDAQTPCEGSFCDPRRCQAGFCRHAPRDCDDHDRATRDLCDEASQRCRHELVDGQRPCEQDSDCDTDHVCERLSCQFGLCRVIPDTAECVPRHLRPITCHQNTDCISVEDGVCWAGPCKDGFCQFRRVEHSKCEPCEGDHDCEGSFCWWPICTGTVCVVEDVPFCADDNPDTRDTCSEERLGCLHQYTKTPPHCAHAPPDDGDPQTLEACGTENGETLHLPRADGDCATTDRCWVTYRGPEGFCLATPLHCHHDDACPARCDPNRGCVLDPNRDCHCEQDSDCDLGNPCARVYCMSADGGACWGTFVDDCMPCKTDTDCRVDDWCVFGSCHEGYCRYLDGHTCDDGDPDTFGFCHGQRDDPCTYERIYDESAGPASAPR